MICWGRYKVLCWFYPPLLIATLCLSVIMLIYRWWHLGFKNLSHFLRSVLLMEKTSTLTQFFHFIVQTLSCCLAPVHCLSMTRLLLRTCFEGNWYKATPTYIYIYFIYLFLFIKKQVFIDCQVCNFLCCALQRSK